MAIVKKRNWAFVLYPESAPDNWKDMLQETGLPCSISPLHDKDIDPDGNPKKAHYHIIVCYNGPTSFNVVSKITDSLKQPIPQGLESVKGYFRYFTHKDNPDKYQYNENEIQFVNGFSPMDFIELRKSEVFQIKWNLQKLIMEKNIVEYGDLMEYLLLHNMREEHDIASSHTLFFSAYIRSRRHRSERGGGITLADDDINNIPSDLDIENNNFNISDRVTVDPETGEFLEIEI